MNLRFPKTYIHYKMHGLQLASMLKALVTEDETHYTFDTKNPSFVFPPSRGFGDTVAQLTRYLPIENCNCGSRAETLNRIFPYENNDAP